MTWNLEDDRAATLVTSIDYAKAEGRAMVVNSAKTKLLCFSDALSTYKADGFIQDAVGSEGL